MNKLIKELAEQATEYNEQTLTGWLNPEKFAELIILECAEVAGKTRWAVPPTQEQIASSIRQHFGVEE